MLVTGLCVAFGNSLIHLGKLLLIGIDIILGHGHDTLVVLFNHIHVAVELGTVYAFDFEAVGFVLYKVLTGNRFLNCNSGILELLALIIIALLNYLNDRQVIIL